MRNASQTSQDQAVFTIRIRRELLEAVRPLAERENRTVSQQIRVLLERYVEEGR